MGGQIRESYLINFSAIIAKPIEEARIIMDKIPRTCDPESELKMLEEEILVRPLVDRLRSVIQTDDKLSDTSVDFNLLTEMARNYGIRMGQDRLVLAMERVIEKTEA